jgi:hypothetical protein
MFRHGLTRTHTERTAALQLEGQLCHGLTWMHVDRSAAGGCKGVFATDALGRTRIKAGVGS